MVSMCIDMMFSDLPFGERLRAAKACGADAVEFWEWSNKDLQQIRESGVKVSIFNIDSRDGQLSYDLSRGILNDGRKADFLRALEESIPVYQMLDASGMIVLLGEHKPYNEEQVYSCLSAALPLLEQHGVRLLVEPLNHFDREGYCMPWAEPVLALLKRLNSPHIQMLYDIYHQNRMGDFSMAQVEENMDSIGHFHVADCPGRHEPGTGVVDYVSILKRIKELQFEGYVGLEYRATKPDRETLAFLKEAGYV